MFAPMLRWDGVASIGEQRYGFQRLSRCLGLLSRNVYAIGGSGLPMSDPVLFVPPLGRRGIMPGLRISCLGGAVVADPADSPPNHCATT